MRIRLTKLPGFALFYCREVLLSNLRVARDVLRPRMSFQPAIIAFPLEARTDLEILLLSNLITMTPGTLSMDVSTDRTTLYIHSMYAPDPDALKAELKDQFERRVLELLR